MLILNQNVYWFQGYPADDSQKIELKPIIFQKLMALYKSLAPDIILLQEIQSAEVAKQTASALDMSYFYTPGEELSRYGGLVLYKKNLNLNLIKMDFSIQFQRVCQIVEYKDQDLILCNLHLPSNAQISEEQAIIKRREELNAIFNSPFKPDIIGGDFNENEFKNWPSVEYTLQNNYFDAISHNIQKNRNTKIKGKRGDFIFMINEKKSSLQAFYTIDLEEYKLQSKDAFHLSDHFPLCIECKNS